MARMLSGLCILLFFASPVFGDTGRIVTDSANVREESQKAIILHNLDEEVLILGTDLVSDRKTKIIRFIPFPSEPTVSLAEGYPFARIVDLIKKYDLSFIYATKSMDGPSVVPVEIHFNAKLGAHDVTTVKINQIGEFGDWVRGFLAGKGLSLGDGFPQVEAIAADYVANNIRYFVFDLVEVTPEINSIKPLVYRFNSKKLYYPLKTSNTFGGAGGIDLIIVAPVTLCAPLLSEARYIPQNFSPNSCMRPLSKKNPFSYPVSASTSAEISRADAESVYAPAGQLFQDGESIFMQLIRYHGAYDFEDDILIDISTAPREEYGYTPAPTMFVPPPEVYFSDKRNKRQ